MLYSRFMPSLAFTEEGNHRTHWLFQCQIDSLLPFYGYLTRDLSREDDTENLRTIMLAEAEEGASPEEDIPESTEQPGDKGEEMEELLRAENEAALQMQQFTAFTPHGKQMEVDLAPLADYETLVKQFYTVDNNTMAGSDQLNVEKFLGTDLSIDKESDGPQILIYHTHSQEGYSDSVPGDTATSIMGVGERLTGILTEEYGYKVLHHLGQYDTESRNDSYAEALTDLERILQEYPSIEVMIDLHRDEMPESTRLVMDLDGKPTARFMFFNGLSRTKKTGNIAYLYNENLEANLAFSFQMQLKAMEYYPGLTRRIYLKGYRYNLHLRPRSLLVELGAQNNTVEEAMNACGPLAHVIDLVLSGEEE